VTRDVPPTLTRLVLVGGIKYCRSEFECFKKFNVTRSDMVTVTECLVLSDPNCNQPKKHDHDDSRRPGNGPGPHVNVNITASAHDKVLSSQA
jgi:hypothetical protein